MTSSGADLLVEIPLSVQWSLVYSWTQVIIVPVVLIVCLEDLSVGVIKCVRQIRKRVVDCVHQNWINYKVLSSITEFVKIQSVRVSSDEVYPVTKIKITFQEYKCWEVTIGC